jgi:hypothetical protein
MDFGFDARTLDLRKGMLAFMENLIAGEGDGFAIAQWVIDKAIQAHGGGGVSQDFPLAQLWANARSLRSADGPDEVHKRSLARRELRKATS